MVCRYQAGAAGGLPFFPLRSYAGSDLPTLNPQIRLVDDPYGEGSIYVVPPLNPDVTIIHAQRADRSGNVQIWASPAFSRKRCTRRNTRSSWSRRSSTTR